MFSPPREAAASCTLFHPGGGPYVPGVLAWTTDWWRWCLRRHAGCTPTRASSTSSTARRDRERKHDAMKRIPPSIQMQQAFMQNLQAGIQGHPLRQFVARAAKLMLQVGLEAQVEAFSGRRPLRARVAPAARMAKRLRHPHPRSRL